LDALKMLERDHRRVEAMLKQLSESETGPERAALTSELTKALELHMRFEEEHIYPLMQEIDREMAGEAEVEHGLAREGLASAAELVDQPGFSAAVEMLTAGIAHHVEEEEGEAFPKLRQQCGEARLASLATTLLEEKRQAGMLVPEDATKEELQEIAAELGVEARSSMTKEELKEALAGRV
jgi:hemerythrin superfamily protein